MKFYLYFSLSLILFSFHVQAEQLKFSKKQHEELTQFNYLWLDQNKQQQSLSFALPTQEIFSHFRGFKAYKPQFITRFVNKRIHQQLQKQPIKNVQVHFIKNTRGSEISIKGKDDVSIASAYVEIGKLQQQFTNEYLASNNYHRFTAYNQVTGIKPNHVKVANDSVKDLKPLKPLILDKVSAENIRKATNYTLGFVQSIPYSTLNSRRTSSGAGFNPPLRLLWENQGDCDSKVTLTASLLRSLMPRIKMVLVFIDQHALIGIDVKPKAGEATISLDKTTYVLAEPTGPAMYQLGDISPDSKQAVDHGHYAVEKFLTDKK